MYALIHSVVEIHPYPFLYVNFSERLCKGVQPTEFITRHTVACLKKNLLIGVGFLPFGPVSLKRTHSTNSNHLIFLSSALVCWDAWPQFAFFHCPRKRCWPKRRTQEGLKLTTDAQYVGKTCQGSFSALLAPNGEFNELLQVTCRLHSNPGNERPVMYLNSNLPLLLV